MQLLHVLVFAGAVVASPLGKRATGTTANEFKDGGCRDIILFFARGTSEPGNMGSVGALLSDALKGYYGESRVAAQGIDYSATVLPNTFPGGCDPKDAAVMAGLINQAASQCPDSKLIASGYSQGAALTHRGVEQLSADVMAKIGAAVTFGDTQKKQDGARIPNFPPEKTDIICNDGDRVCEGTLIIEPAHLDYARRVPDAASFIEGKIPK